MKFGIIVAARTGSKRLPGKALMPILGTPVISLIVRRLKTSKRVSKIIFATTVLPEDDELTETVQREGVDVFRGSESDVLSRYVNAALPYDFDFVVRITGDCPFVDGTTLDHILEQCLKFPSFDLVTTKPAYPHGIDYEVYPKKLLEEINGLHLTKEEREHHLNYIYRNEKKFKIHRLIPPAELTLKDTIFLLDTPEDYAMMTAMLKGLNDIFISPVELIKKYLHANYI